MANKLTKTVSWTVNKARQYPKLALWAWALAVDWIANSFWVTKTLWTAVKWVVGWVKSSVDTLLAAKSWWAMVWAMAPFALYGLWGYYSSKLADKMKLKWWKKLAMQALWVWAWITVAGSSLAPAALVAWLVYPVWKGTIAVFNKSKDVAKSWWKWAVERPTKAVVWWITPLVKAPFKAIWWIGDWFKWNSFQQLVTA